MSISCQVVTNTNQPLEGLLATLSSGEHVFEGCTDQFGCINTWFPYNRDPEQPEDGHWIMALANSVWRIVLSTDSAWSHFHYIPVQFNVEAHTHSRIRFVLNGVLLNGENGAPDSYSISYEVKAGHSLPPTSGRPGIMIGETHLGVPPADNYIPLDDAGSSSVSTTCQQQSDTEMAFSLDDCDTEEPPRGRKRKSDESEDHSFPAKRQLRRSVRLRNLGH